MAMTLYEAAKISQNRLVKGVMLGVATTNQLMSVFPWVPQIGSALTYSREKALPTAEFVAPDHTSLTESSATFAQQVQPFRVIDTDVDTYNTTVNQSDPNGDPADVQLAQKLKAAGRLIQSKMITGSHVTGFVASNATVTPGLAVDAAVPGPGHNSNSEPGSLKYTHTGTFWQYRAPGDRTYGAQVAIAADGSATLYSDNGMYLTVTIDVSDATADGECLIRYTSSNNEPDGLQKLIPDSQVVASASGDANGSALSFETLDKLIYEKVKTNNNRVFLMNGSLIRKFRALVRSSAGGTTPEQIAIPMLGMDGRLGQQLVPQYDGIPVLQVDDIPSTESKGSASTLSSVYLVDMMPELGFWGGCQQSQPIEVDLDPYRTRVMGFKLYDVGQLEDKAANRKRVEWYGAFGLGSELAAARAKELVTI